MANQAMASLAWDLTNVAARVQWLISLQAAGRMDIVRDALIAYVGGA